MVVFPNAKINLGLNVLRRRPDGYHDVATVMIAVPWCDVLEVVPSKSGATELHLSGRPVACPPEKNLVMKAYRALCHVADVPSADIYLHKVVPDGAGLGGGSADAAFTLLALNEAFNLGISKEILAEVASQIGADCPFFVYDTPMLCTGTGTTLTRCHVDLKGYTLLLAKQRAESVATAEAYGGIVPQEDTTNLIEVVALPPELWRANGLKNDFETTVFALHPAIARLKEQIERGGAVYASMSGSGAAVFGIFRDKAAALAVQSELTDCDSMVHEF